jgi:hypothetical protein
MAKATTTTTTTTTPAAIVGHRDATVGALINKAGRAAASMLQLCKEAAQGAAAQLNPSQPMGERIEAVVSLYAEDFKSAGHNVKALFKDALILLAAAQTPVTVTAIGKDGKKVDQHVTAAEAAAMPKHAMRDAAKQVREAHGIARKSGGGRKPAAKTTAKPAAKVAPAPDIKGEVEAFAAWLDNLEEYMTDHVYHGRIVARLIEMGYTLGKATQGRKVRGKASA